HELTHAIFAIFSGSRVKKIKVTAKGGYVEMSQSNLIIDLAPYFFPIFAIVWTALFLTGDRLWNWEDYYHVFFFGLGVLTAFHYACSWDVLKIEQPDMAMTGKIFGIIFVLLANLLIVNVIIVILFAGDVNLENIWINTYEAYYFWRKILFGQV
nr:hypothetical protein [bacterium]